MANELTKSVMAAVVQRLGQSAGYEPIKRNPKTSDEGYYNRQTDQGARHGLSSAEENTLKKLIHKDIRLSDQPLRVDTEAMDPPRNWEDPSLAQMGKGGVVRLDDLLKALKK